MRPTLYLTCLAVLLALAASGPATAAPVYGPLADQPGAFADLIPGGTLWESIINDYGSPADSDAELRSLALGVAVDTYADHGTYLAAVGPHDLLTFTEPVVNPGDALDSQYAAVSVLFTDNDDAVMASPAFVTDGVGVNGNADFSGDGSITMQFATPQTHLGVDFPGELRIELYASGTGPADLIWSSEGMGDFGTEGSTGNFAGVASDVSFDHVILSDPRDDWVFIDNVHYLVPEPGTLALVAVGVLALTGRGRRARLCG